MRTAFLALAVACSTFAGLTPRAQVEEKVRTLYRLIDIPARALFYFVKKEPETRYILQNTWSTLIDPTKTLAERKTDLEKYYPKDVESLEEIVPLFEGVHQVVLKIFSNNPDRGEQFFSDAYGLLMEDRFLDGTSAERREMVRDIVQHYRKFL